MARQVKAPEVPAPVEPEHATIPDAAPPAADQSDPVEMVEVEMTIAISGLRDGQPWPRPGKTIKLPADEAETYLRLGYAREA